MELLTGYEGNAFASTGHKIIVDNFSEKHEELKILNSCIKECDRCRLSFGRVHAVCGEGNVDARLFFIAQAPGEMEDKAGKMFVGPTGKVINELFHEVSLKREEVYMTNLIKCRLPKNRKPKSDEVELCGKYLDQEIEMIKPEFLIPLGYHAAKYVFNHYCKMISLSPDSTGKLVYCNGQKIYPLQHPSAVLYNPSFKHTMIRAFKRISVFKKDCKWYPMCPMKRFFEEGRLDKKWIELYCQGDWESCVRYQMEEKGEFHPDNMLPDGTINYKIK